MTERDPQGKRALFEAPPAQLEDAEDHEPADGTDALYSSGPHRPGTVALDCSRCGIRTRMSLVEVGVRIAYLSLWFPGRRYSRYMQCPECQRRTWCRVEWFG